MGSPHRPRDDGEVLGAAGSTAWAAREAESACLGKVLESDPPRRLVLTWASPEDAPVGEDSQSRVTFDLERVGEVVRLTVTHDRMKPGSEMMKSISAGWPEVLSSLKSLLEAGEPLPSLW